MNRRHVLRATLAMCALVTCAGFGNLALKRGMDAVGPLQRLDPVCVLRFCARAVSTPWVDLGIVLELVYFVLWLAVLSWADVSWAVPMNAMEYVFVGALGAVLLGEHVGPARWVGICLIITGVVCMMKSWDHPPETAPAASPEAGP